MKYHFNELNERAYCNYVNFSDPILQAIVSIE